MGMAGASAARGSAVSATEIELAAAAVFAPESGLAVMMLSRESANTAQSVWGQNELEKTLRLELMLMRTACPPTRRQLRPK
jgi:hypothetical protein